MKKIKVIAISLAIVSVLVSGVYADEAYKESRYSEDGLKERVIKKLNLTQEQQGKLAEHRKAHRESMMKLRAAMKEERAELQEELRKPDFTEATVRPLVEEIKALQSEMIDLRVDGVFAVKDILTPEQFVKFQQIVKHKKEILKKGFHEWQENKKNREHE